MRRLVAIMIGIVVASAPQLVRAGFDAHVTPPQTLADETLSEIRLATDGRGNWVAVGERQPAGVVALRSADNGVTWTDPQVVRSAAIGGVESDVRVVG